MYARQQVGGAFQQFQIIRARNRNLIAFLFMFSSRKRISYKVLTKRRPSWKRNLFFLKVKFENW